MVSINTLRSFLNEIPFFSDTQDLSSSTSKMNSTAAKMANNGNQAFFDYNEWYETKNISLIRARVALEEIRNDAQGILIFEKFLKRDKHIEKLKAAIEHCALGKAGRSKKAALTVQVESHQADMHPKYSKALAELCVSQLEATQNVERIETEIKRGPTLPKPVIVAQIPSQTTFWGGRKITVLTNIQA